MRSGLGSRGCFPSGIHYPGIAHLLRVATVGLATEWPEETALAELPLVAIDTEATGLSPQEDRLVEVGCVVWEAGQITSRKSWLLNPGRPIPKAAFDVHGISDDDVRDKQKFSEIVDELLEVLRGRVPLAYNAQFDRNFLLAELERAGGASGELPPAFRPKVDWVDPLTWARELHRNEKSRSLTAVCGRLGIDMGQAHRATDDAEAALKVFEQFRQDARMPGNYAALVREQRRLARRFDEEKMYWRS